jgi:hypothetical protein
MAQLRDAKNKILQAKKILMYDLQDAYNEKTTLEQLRKAKNAYQDFYIHTMIALNSKIF